MATSAQKLALITNFSAERSLLELWKLRTDADDPLPIKLGKAALLDIPARNSFFQRIVNSCATREFPGYRLLGGGGEQIVMVAGNRVLKLLVSTQAVEDAPIDSVAQILQTNSDKCASFLGKNWVPTIFEVVKGRKSGRNMIIASQPLVRAEILYGTTREVVADDRLAEACRVNLAEAITALHDDSGLYPDLLGINNIVGVDGGAVGRDLRMVDTVAVTSRKQQLMVNQSNTVGESIQRELAVLAGA